MSQHKTQSKRATAPPPTVSARWLLTATSLALVAAAACCWGVLCFLFWQGSWQLLYRPTAAVRRTPASVGLAFDPVAFAAAEDGQSRLKGWWIPGPPGADYSRYTVLYLHGQTGNLGDSVDDLAALHTVGVNILAFDYRGYGQSRFVRPSEAHWRQDTEWALQYLAGTRHIAPQAIVLDGTGLGADLALEEAAAHPELAGVIVELPLADPTRAIFNDARAQVVPAHLLVRDRYDLNSAAANVRLPVLWFASDERSAAGVVPNAPDAYGKIGVRKMLVWLNPSGDLDKQTADALSRWLDDLLDELPAP
jgi:pimeloyl-ACP methyl ester carboxylesterase